MLMILGDSISPFYYFSRKQKCPSRSTEESEYVAINDSLQIVDITINLLREIGLRVRVIWHEDNTPVIHDLSNINPYVTDKLYIDVKVEYVKYFMRSRYITMVYIPTEEMKADILTKAMYGKKFREQRFMITGYDVINPELQN
jgi:hypothetical protein